MNKLGFRNLYLRRVITTITLLLAVFLALVGTKNYADANTYTYSCLANAKLAKVLDPGGSRLFLQRYSDRKSRKITQAVDGSVMRREDDVLIVAPPAQTNLRFFGNSLSSNRKYSSSSNGRCKNNAPINELGFEARLKAENQQVLYRFPCAEIKNGNNGFRWSGEFWKNGVCSKVQVRSSNKSVKTKSENSAFQVAQGTENISKEVISSRVQRYCSAASEFSNAWGFSVESSQHAASSGSQWDVFSNKDPCKQAIDQCEKESRKPGPSCQIASKGILPVDESEVVLSLKCFGNESNPNTSIPPYSSSGNALEIDALAAELRKKARDARATSCRFDFYYPDALVISPSTPNDNQEAIAEAKEVDDKIIVTATHGSIGIFDAGIQKETILAESEVYVQSSPSIEKIDDVARHNLIYSQPVFSLIDSQVISKTDQHYAKTASGKEIKLSEQLGFKIDLCPTSLNLCSDWRVIEDKNDLEIALEHIRRQEPVLSAAYVSESLNSIKYKNPDLGVLLQEEVNHYLTGNKSRITAFDFKDLASLNAEKRIVDFEKYKSLVQTDTSKLVKYRPGSEKSEETKEVAGQTPLFLQIEIALKGSYGEAEAGYEKIPQIGAGLNKYSEGSQGESVNLVLTEYFIKNLFASQQNEYFSISFVTTPDRVDRYKTIFDEIVRSFRFLKP